MTLWLRLLLALTLALLFAAAAGHDWAGPEALLRVVTGDNSLQSQLLAAWRFPRVLAAGLVGALLGLGGAIFQGVFRNPLAEPYLLGSAGGAAIGATIALLVPLGLPGGPLLAALSFLGAWGATWLVLAVAGWRGRPDMAGLLLAGVAVAAMLGALRSFLMLALSDDAVNLQVVLSWTLGGIQTPGWPGLGLLAVLTLAALLASHSLARGLDLLGLGEEQAHAFGLDPSRFNAPRRAAGGRDRGRRRRLGRARRFRRADRPPHRALVGRPRPPPAAATERRAWRGHRHGLRRSRAGGPASRRDSARPHHSDRRRAVLPRPAVAEAEGMNGVRAKNLTCIAGGATILDDVTLTFSPGQLVGVIGPNGAGKSTLLRHLAGYLQPSSGAVAWNDRDLRLWSGAERGAASGYLPQQSSPAWDYSVREIVALDAARVGGRAGSLHHTLKAFDLVALVDRRWSCLSGGERARAMLASVLTTRPSLVFADEPGASLDIRHRLDLMARFKVAAADSVVIVAMHDLDLAARYCDRIVLLDKGRVAADASAQTIIHGDVLERVFGVKFQRQTLDPDRDCLLPMAVITAR